MDVRINNNTGFKRDKVNQWNAWQTAASHDRVAQGLFYHWTNFNHILCTYSLLWVRVAVGERTNYDTWFTLFWMRQILKLYWKPLFVKKSRMYPIFTFSQKIGHLFDPFVKCWEIVGELNFILHNLCSMSYCVFSYMFIKWLLYTI